MEREIFITINSMRTYSGWFTEMIPCSVWPEVNNFFFIICHQTVFYNIDDQRSSLKQFTFVEISHSDVYIFVGFGGDARSIMLILLIISNAKEVSSVFLCMLFNWIQKNTLTSQRSKEHVALMCSLTLRKR